MYVPLNLDIQQISNIKQDNLSKAIKKKFLNIRVYLG